jgi:hypothetical protein
VGIGASQVPVGARATEAAPPTVVVRKVGPDGVGAAGIPAEVCEAEGTAGLGGAGTVALRSMAAAISTFPTKTWCLLVMRRILCARSIRVYRDRDRSLLPANGND